MRVKIEDMRDWLRDFVMSGNNWEEIIEDIESATNAEIAEAYVYFKFGDRKVITL